MKTIWVITIAVLVAGVAFAVGMTMGKKSGYKKAMNGESTDAAATTTTTTTTTSADDTADAA